MAIARIAPSLARRARICPVLILIILVDHLISIQWSHGQEVGRFVLAAAWRLNRCAEIIATAQSETLTGAFILARVGCLRIRAIDLISKGTGAVPPPNVHSVMGFAKHLPDL
jgi:hypothetical protein